jgi:hypothetical protein
MAAPFPEHPKTRQLAVLIAGLITLLFASASFGEELEDQRPRFLISALDRRIPEIDKGDVAMVFLLDAIAKEASEQGFEKDPRKRVTITMNGSFLKESGGSFDPERMQIHFDTKLRDVRLDTVLRQIGSQLGRNKDDRFGGTFFVRENSIELVSREKACEELGLKLIDDEPLPLLVHRIFARTKLEDALEQIGERYNQNIVIAPQAATKAATPITARLVNVPVTTAVETLAEMADLRVVRRVNVLYVTTKEQAAEIRAEHAKREPKLNKVR